LFELLSEGPFWKGIRGAGLSYGYSLFASRDSGLLQFSLYRATDVLKALETAKQLIQDYASGKKYRFRLNIFFKLALCSSLNLPYQII
jgi:Zn-dependent M16 (insulinase) family peptidase